MTARPFAAANLLVSLLALGSATALIPVAGVAQQLAPGAATPPRERPLPGRHIEGRIAFLRAELKITGGQQANWEKVAATMRDSARRMDQLAQEMRAARGQDQSAVDRLEQRARLTEARAAADKSFAAAFKPLYASLSDDQKKSADELFARSFRRGGRR